LALVMRIGYSGASPYQVGADRGVGVFLGLRPQAESFRPFGAEIKISGFLVALGTLRSISRSGALQPFAWT
jgi:hypothetical protein